MDGILLVDKAKGPTSHDVVARVRRALSQRSVGHAGTLDPMATGLLVIGLGEGTKLLAALTDDDKAYEARIELGTSTDTLDAEGTVTETAAVPTFDRATVERAVLDFVGTHLQVAPAYSAIKRDGRPLYELARRGEVVDAPTREVVLRTVAVGEISDRFIDIRMECGKGFYVRSFARDLAAALGTLGHLSALRRLASGGHRVNDALAYDVSTLITTVVIYSISVLVLHWTVVFTVAIGAVIVLIMKGPAYVADAYPMESMDRPDKPLP